MEKAFADCSEKDCVIEGSPPAAGVQKLDTQRGGALGAGEEREISLLKGSNSSYDFLACELAEVQPNVDLFLEPVSVYIDAAALSRVQRA